MSGYNQNYQGNDYSGNSGSAQSYYNESNADQYQQYQQSQGYQQQQQQGYGQQQPPPYGQNQGYSGQGQDGSDGPSGERGFMGALAGGAAGAFGGAKLGGKATGHTKTSGLVGAIAGAFTGSKMQDAAEDWRDDRHERKEEEKRREEEERRRRDDDNRRHEDRHDSNSGSRGGGHYAGAFSGSSNDIRVDEDGGQWNLRASCRRGDGSYQSSTLSLNEILSNSNGSFQWASSSGGGGGGGGSQSVTVQQGDTLRAIAARYNTSFEEIARHNGINNPDLIYPGQNLQIPGGGSGGGGYSSGGGNFGSSARNVRLVDGGQKLEAELRRGNGDWSYSSIVLDERISNSNGTLRFV